MLLTLLLNKRISIPKGSKARTSYIPDVRHLIVFSESVCNRGHTKSLLSSACLIYISHMSCSSYFRTSIPLMKCAAWKLKRHLLNFASYWSCGILRRQIGDVFWSLVRLLEIFSHIRVFPGFHPCLFVWSGSPL